MEKFRFWPILNNQGSDCTIVTLRQFNAGFGDYIEEREALLGDKTLEEILAEIEQERGGN